MNELHLKYKMETGITIATPLETDNWTVGFSKIYEYIKWLEEKVNEKNKKTNNSKHHHDRNRNR